MDPVPPQSPHAPWAPLEQPIAAVPGAVSPASDRHALAGPLPGMVLVATAASAGAGLVHAAAVGTHAGEDALALAFAACALAQLGAGGVAAVAGVLGVRRRTALGALVAVNVVAVVAWALSRTTGLPVLVDGVEEVGTQDAVAAGLGVLAIAAGALALRARPVWRVGAAQTAVACLGVAALAVPGMTAQHVHGDHAEHDHTAGAEVAAADGHDHDHGEAADAAASGEVAATGEGATSDDGHEHDHAAATGELAAGEAAGPVVSLDDPRLLPAQVDAASELLDETREAMAAFPDEAAVLAAGYRSIGDGRRPGSYEHFIHPAYREDGRELDPSAIEAIVLRNDGGGRKVVVTAMYILEPGSTMADVPDIAGELTTWHDHQNLCWNDEGRLAGVVVNGRCRPGGEFRPTPPMLHVWLTDDQPCGPFAGVDGHSNGGGCEHAH